MSGDMVTAMLVALGAFTIIFIDLMWHRIRIGRLEEKVEQLKLNVSM
jgi:heme exporter protein C